MSWFDWGDKPITSYPAFSSGAAAAVVANPSTTAILAEIDSTKLHAGLYGGASTDLHRTFQVTWRVGASSNANYRLEAAASTALGSTSVRRREIVFSAPNQTAQYTDFWTLQSGDRLRILVDSSFTGNVFAAIEAVPLT